MSAIINFINFQSNNEQLLIEIQGEITHTIENKFNFMFLGKLTKNSEVKLPKLGQLYIEYRQPSDHR